jgi:hypothetical protein
MGETKANIEAVVVRAAPIMVGRTQVVQPD